MSKKEPLKVEPQDSAQIKRDMYLKPHDVDDVTLAFPANVMGTLLPDWDIIPDEFRKNWHGNSNKWCRLFTDWFYSGLKSADGLKFKDGIDRTKAFRHLRACMGSFQPKHEHKTAGVAWLFSLWLDESSTWERGEA